MTAILRRSPAKRRGQSTQVTPRDLALLDRDINGTNDHCAQHVRRKSETSTSIVPTVFQIWSVSQPLPNVESSHILDEIVSTEHLYLAELRSIYSTIVRPYRIERLASSAFIASAGCSAAPVAVTKRHGRSGSLFSSKADKDAVNEQSVAQRSRAPKDADSEYLERSFRSTESMIKSHGAMLSAFIDAKNPHQLISAFVVHVEGLLMIYRSFVLTLPYICTLLPTADDSLPNKLSGYSRFLGPMQRTIKYELLLRRLSKALYKESGSLELQNLVKTALRSAERFCQTLEDVQSAEQAKIYLSTLTTRLGVDVTCKTLAFEGTVKTEALSSKKGCKINYAILFTDGSCFWNSAGNEKERQTRSWLLEKVVRVEDGGCLDLVVHTTLEKSDKTKAIRRAIGFPTVGRPLSTFDKPATSPGKRHDQSQCTVEVVIETKNCVIGEKRRRKETVVDEWLNVGHAQERQQKRFSLGSTTNDSPTPRTLESPKCTLETRAGYF